jgi:hypothetical protein
LKGELVKCPRPGCEEWFVQRHSRHATCGDKECKLWWERAGRKDARYVAENKTRVYNGDVFTDDTRETIIDWLELRKKPLPIERIAKDLNRSVEGVQAQIDAMKASGEYDKILKRLRELRTNSEPCQMSSNRRYYSTGDTKNNLKMRWEM